MFPEKFNNPNTILAEVDSLISLLETAIFIADILYNLSGEINYDKNNAEKAPEFT